MQLFAFLVFTFGVLIVTMVITRKDDHETSDGYFLGGRSLTASVICGSLLLTNLSTEQIIGLTGGAFTEGLVVMAWEVLSALSIILLAVFFLPRYLSRGITTAPEFLEARFDKDTRFFVSILFLLGYACILLPVVLFTGAKALNGIFGVHEMLGVTYAQGIWITVWAMGIIGSVYAVYGGLKAVAISDTFNGIGLLAGGLIIPYLGLKACGDGSVMKGISALVKEHPEKFVVAGGPGSGLPWETIFTGLFILTTFYWCTNQAIIQRALGARSLAEGQKGILLCAFIKIFVPIIVVLPGIIALHLYGDEVPMKEVAGKMVKDGDQAYPILVTKLLPTWMSGFFAAVIFGSILSSFNSALNSAGTLFALDIYKCKINTGADDKAQVKAGRNFSIILAVISMIGAPFLLNAGGIFNFLQAANTIYMVPVFSIFLGGFLSKRVSSKGAKTALLASIIINISFVISELDLHFLHKAAIVLLSSLVIMFAMRGNEVTVEENKPEGYDLNPWPHAKKAGIAIAVIVIAIYAMLWN